jgi:Ca2+:H+ antiporter
LARLISTGRKKPSEETMKPLLKVIRGSPLLWMLAFVPVVLVAAQVRSEAHTLLFVLSVLAIVPLTVLLSHATEPSPPRPAMPSAAS